MNIIECQTAIFGVLVELGLPHEEQVRELALSVVLMCGGDVQRAVAVMREAADEAADIVSAVRERHKPRPRHLRLVRT